MANHNKKLDSPFLKACRDTWYDIPEEVIPEEKRIQYKARKRAVDMYIDDMKTSDIAHETGISRTHIIDLVEKCLQIGDDGFYLGYFALIPNYKGMGSNVNREFNKLLEEYPDLKEFIIGNYLGDRKFTLEQNMNYKTLHARFLRQCKELGIQDYEYPFNTQTQGYVSLIKYVKEFARKNIEAVAKRESKDACQKLMSTGKGIRYSQNSLIVLNTVQFDGHKLDIGYTVEVDNNDGTFSHIMAIRPWFLPVFDISTRAVIGYYMSQSENYNQYDLIKAIQNAILPHKKVHLTIPGLKYPENGGFPSTAFPEYEYALFNVIMLDNAKSHLAHNIINTIVEKLGCAVVFGSVATPETRGIIERFFGTLESKGFHRLPGTTGSNTKDPKRKDPENEVVKYNITYDQICEILDVLCAEYNNTPHSALNNETPLQAMERKLSNPFIRPTIADEGMLKKVLSLTHFIRTVTVRGNIKKGKRPYIQYMNATYRNDLLSSDSSLIGKKINIEVDPDDVTSVVAYTESGYPLGTLYAAGGYGKTKHSLKTRKDAAKLARINGKDKNIYADPIHNYQKHLQNNSKGNRRMATRADQVRREAGIQEFSKEEIRPLTKESARIEETINPSAITEIIDGKPKTRVMTMEEYLKANNIG